MLVLQIFILPAHAFESSDSLRIELLSPSEVEVAPRQVLTTSILLTNPTEEPKTFRIAAETPSGWQNFITPEILDLGPGDSVAVFINIMVPADVLAGDYGMTLIAYPEGSPSDSVSAAVEVTVIGVIELEVLGRTDQPAATTGDILIQTYTVTNLGNAQSRVAIDVDSHPDWPITIDPPDREFLLEPGQPRNVIVTVTVPEEMAQSLTHRLTILVRSLDPAAVDVEVSARISTRIIPRQLAGSVYSTLDGEIKMITSLLDGDDPSYLITLDPLEGNLGEGREVRLGFRNLLLEGSTSGTFVHRQRMWAIYNDENMGYLRVGDLSLNLESPLIQRYVSGRGVEALIHNGPYDLRLFYTRTRGSSPRENFGLQLGYPIGSTGLLRFTALREPGQEGMEGFTNYGVLAGYSPFEGAELTGELGRTHSDLPGSESAWRLAGNLAGDRFSARCEWLRAGKGYRGGWQDTELRRLNMWWNPVRDVGIWSDYSLSLGNITKDPEFEARYSRNVGYGISWKIEELGRIRISHREIRDWDDILGSYDRLTRLTVYSLNRRWGDVSTTASLEHQSTDYRVMLETELIRSMRLDLAMNMNRNANLRLSYTLGRPSRNNTLPGGDTSNFILGSQLRLSNDLRISLNVQRNTGGYIGRRTDIFGTARWSISPDHYLNLSIRDYSGTYGGDTEVALEYTQPISISLGMFPRMGSVEGRLFMADNPEQGVRNAVITVGSIEVITGDRGQFAYPALEPGQYQLTVDPVALGVGMAPVIDMPLIFTIDAGSVTRLEIPVAETASVGGRVSADIPASRGQPASTWPMAEFKVELIGEDGSDFRFTDQYGNYVFSGLLPGVYVIILRPEYLPEGHEIADLSSYELELAPGDSVMDLHFTVRPVVEDIEFTVDKSISSE